VQSQNQADMRLKAPGKWRSIAARVGKVSFLFFLLKGMLWLALLAWLYFTR
jgi:hypothetical protein